MRHIFTLVCCFSLVTALQGQKVDPPAYYIFSIYFGGGSDFIDEQQVQDLYQWLDGIPDVETHSISIHSHTDNIGSIEYNQWLSRRRSEAAMQKLINKGLPPEIMTISDFGKLNPIYDNSTWEGRLRNRRVDIIIKPVVM
jgi:outer membrane protein OmpA-like peptidoglycan-associated protein